MPNCIIIHVRNDVGHFHYNFHEDSWEYILCQKLGVDIHILRAHLVAEGIAKSLPFPIAIVLEPYIHTHAKFNLELKTNATCTLIKRTRGQTDSQTDGRTDIFILARNVIV